MPSDYERICCENIKEYGEGTRHLAFLGRLYSERTHFIYELLQNAEDAEGTTLEFHLWPDHLEILHDGRPFNEADVRGICGVGEGTSAEDLTKIGKFGVGFKSVYAYVTNPEIHSGGEHFRIEHYVRPYAVKPRTPEPRFTTMFILPFCNGSVPTNQAFNEIGTTLRGLSPTILLFLRHIKSVIVTSNAKHVGQFVRNVHNQPSDNVRHVWVEATHAKGGREDWLLFDRQVPLKKDGGSEVKLPVELAFRLELDTHKKRHSIVPVMESPLVVFFPTEKLTHLGFLIQGPYRTTPARDNVPSNVPVNIELVRATAELILQSLRWLKAQKLLTIKVLETLPIDEDRFPDKSMFRPIYDSIRNAIQNEEFLPLHTHETDGTAFGAGRRVYSARSGDLRQLVTPAQLSKLMGAERPLSWLSSEITADKTPQLWNYLRSKIGVKEIHPAVFVGLLNREFLACQSDQWINRLYCFLAGQAAWLSALRYKDIRNVPFFNKPIIRLNDGRHVAPFKSDGMPSAFLPSDGRASFDSVKATVVETKEARDFLTNLGYAVPDECDEIFHNVLPRYESGKLPKNDEYQRDLSRIFAALKTDSMSKRKTLQAKLESLRFVRAINAATNVDAAKTPKEVYFSSPDLHLYFQGNQNAWFVDSALEKYRRNLIELGSSETVRIQFQKPDADGHVTICEEWGNHERALGGFDPKCKVVGLQHALENPDTKRSAFVWNSVLVPHWKMIRGQVESSTRQDFLHPETKETPSDMGQIVIDSTWLPTKTGGFHRPRSVSLDDLPNEFHKHEEVARQLRMKLHPSRGEAAQFAAKLGVSLEDIDYLKKHPLEFQEFKRWQDDRNKKPTRPVVESPNPVNRQERVAAQARNAATIDRQIRNRQVRVNWETKTDARTTLRDLNTNEDDQMVCQVCGEEMPFKLNDDSYYFEAVPCVKGIDRELPQNYVALCPVCAAKFLYANGTPPVELKQAILATNSSNSLEVAVILARESCHIHFTKIHLQDLQTALQVVGR